MTNFKMLQHDEDEQDPEIFGPFQPEIFWTGGGYVDEFDEWFSTGSYSASVEPGELGQLLRYRLSRSTMVGPRTLRSVKRANKPSRTKTHIVSIRYAPFGSFELEVAKVTTDRRGRIDELVVEAIRIFESDRSRRREAWRLFSRSSLSTVYLVEGGEGTERLSPFVTVFSPYPSGNQNINPFNHYERQLPVGRYVVLTRMSSGALSTRYLRITWDGYSSGPVEPGRYNLPLPLRFPERHVPYDRKGPIELRGVRGSTKRVDEPRRITPQKQTSITSG